MINASDVKERIQASTLCSFSDYDYTDNHKNYNFFDCDWFKSLLFYTNLLTKLLSESLLSDSFISQSHSKLKFKSSNLSLSQIFLHNLAILLFSEIIIFVTRDKQIWLPLRVRPIFLSLVWLQTELDSTQSYYHCLLREIPNKLLLEPSADCFKSPCLLELRKNAIEVELRVPGNDIEFPFP